MSGWAGPEDPGSLGVCVCVTRSGPSRLTLSPPCSATEDCRLDRASLTSSVSCAFDVCFACNSFSSGGIPLLWLSLDAGRAQRPLLPQTPAASGSFSRNACFLAHPLHPPHPPPTSPSHLHSSTNNNIVGRSARCSLLLSLSYSLPCPSHRLHGAERRSSPRRRQHRPRPSRDRSPRRAATARSASQLTPTATSTAQPTTGPMPSKKTAKRAKSASVSGRGKAMWLQQL